MARFIRRPLVVEATQWFPGVLEKIVQYPPFPGTEKGRAYLVTYGECGMFEGLLVMPGDWIVIGDEISMYEREEFERMFVSLDE